MDKVYEAPCEQTWEILDFFGSFGPLCYSAGLWSSPIWFTDPGRTWAGSALSVERGQKNVGVERESEKELRRSTKTRQVDF